MTSWHQGCSDDQIDITYNLAAPLTAAPGSTAVDGVLATDLVHSPAQGRRAGFRRQQ